MDLGSVPCEGYGSAFLKGYFRYCYYSAYRAPQCIVVTTPIKIPGGHES
jgi:hypothetical protein